MNYTQYYFRFCKSEMQEEEEVNSWTFLDHQDSVSDSDSELIMEEVVKDLQNVSVHSSGSAKHTKEDNAEFDEAEEEEKHCRFQEKGEKMVDAFLFCTISFCIIFIFCTHPTNS